MQVSQSSRASSTKIFTYAKVKVHRYLHTYKYLHKCPCIYSFTPTHICSPIFKSMSLTLFTPSLAHYNTHSIYSRAQSETILVYQHTSTILMFYFTSLVNRNLHTKIRINFILKNFKEVKKRVWSNKIYFQSVISFSICITLLVRLQLLPILPYDKLGRTSTVNTTTLMTTSATVTTITTTTTSTQLLFRFLVLLSVSFLSLVYFI